MLSVPMFDEWSLRGAANREAVAVRRARHRLQVRRLAVRRVRARLDGPLPAVGHLDQRCVNSPRLIESAADRNATSGCGTRHRSQVLTVGSARARNDGPMLPVPALDQRVGDLASGVVADCDAVVRSQALHGIERAICRPNVRARHERPRRRGTRRAGKSDCAADQKRRDQSAGRDTNTGPTSVHSRHP